MRGDPLTNRQIAVIWVGTVCTAWWICYHAIMDLWGLGQWVWTHLTAPAG